MTMTYSQIPDWPRLRERHLAFWNNEVRDNAIIAHIQNPNPCRPAPQPWMLEESPEKYLDPGKFFDLVTWLRTAWNWHADLFKYEIPKSDRRRLPPGCSGKYEG